MSDLQQEVARMAAEAVAIVRDRTGATIDFSEASLSSVEEALEEASGYFAGLNTDQATKLIQWFGCYVLEVGRKQFGGEYLWHDKRDQPVLVIGEPKFHVAIITWNRVRGRVLGDKGDNIPFFFEGFAERAKRAKPGDRALFV
jgi:hypothetical protein